MPVHAGKTVLIVDDEASIRDLLEDALVSEGYDVRTAASTDAALAAVDARRPDVILLDMRMPDDGPQFKAELVRRSFAAPIIAMSASAGASAWAAAFGAPFLAKPFGLDEVFSAVRVALAD